MEDLKIEWEMHKYLVFSTTLAGACVTYTKCMLPDADAWYVPCPFARHVPIITWQYQYADTGQVEA